MLATFTQLLIGFSVVSAAILLVAYVFFLPDMQKTVVGRMACAALLIALAGLQLGHLAFLENGAELFELRAYVVLLLLTPPTFFFFSREILLADTERRWLDALHFVPLALSFFVETGLIAPVAFVIGTGYSIWFARVVYGMRRHLGRFRIEMFFFTLFAVLAVLVLLLGLALPVIETAVFYMAYANFIGIAMLLVTGALIVFPDLLQDISDTARLSYAKTTLDGVNVAAKLAELERMMRADKLYQNEDLNLALCAAAVDLSAHQLSELINTRFGLGYSRYIREIRIAEAQRLLAEDSRSSVLAISLMTGFKSQSTFYAAFREITGETPAAWRKKRRPG